MDALDRELHDRLEALSDAVPVASRGSNGLDVRLEAGRRWRTAPTSQPGPAPRRTPREPWRHTGLGVAVVLVILVAASIVSLLFLGGEISGVLNTVGGPISEPSPESRVQPEQVGHVSGFLVLQLCEPAVLGAVAVVVR